MAVAVLWFRRDLRLDDSPALVAAAAAGADGVVPLFVVDPKVLRPAGPTAVASWPAPCGNWTGS